MALCSPVWAQTTAPSAPNAGQVLRELERPAPLSPAPTAALRLPAETENIPEGGLGFVLRSIRIEGATLIPVSELQPLVADLQGKEVTLSQLRQGARRITSLYRDRGFALARAYLPAQEVKDGVVTIQVLEGRLGRSTVVNRSGVSTSLIEEIVAAQNPKEEAVQSARTDRALLLLADLPGTGPVSGNLRPGDRVGTSDLVVQVEPGKGSEGELALDNYGNRYTGEYRLNARVAYNNLAHWGDRFELRSTLSNEKLSYARASFDLPVAHDGLRVGAAYSLSHYELGQEFENLDAMGTAQSTNLYASYPVYRSLDRNVWLATNLEDRRLEDNVGLTQSISHKKADVLNIDAYGDVVDSLLGGGYSTWRASILNGNLDIQTPVTLAIDQSGPRTQGRYNKLQLNVTRLQSLPASTQLSVALAGQWADKNLDSSEKFVLGGAYGVRAYPQGEGSGDEGWLANVEWRKNVMANVQASVFYDAGHVKVNDQPYTEGRNTTTLHGYGVGAQGEWGGINVKATLAWRGDERATSAPDHSPRLWVQVAYRF